MYVRVVVKTLVRPRGNFSLLLRRKTRSRSTFTACYLAIVFEKVPKRLVLRYRLLLIGGINYLPVFQ